MKSLSTLPEELLDKIVSNIHNRTSSTPRGPHIHPDIPTLCALCLTSRTLSRIAKPFLYTSICSTSGSMGHSLYRTLQADTTSNLRRHVREFSVTHSQSGCQEVDETQNISDAGYGRTIDVCQILFQRTIELLPNLEVVDLSRLQDKGGYTWLNALHAAYDANEPLWYASTPWANVTSMAIHLDIEGTNDFWVLFRLPRLREFEVEMRKARNLGLAFESERWPVGISPIEVFRIVGMHDRLAVTHIDWMSIACKALRSVFVATEDMLHLDFFPWIFKGHIRSGALKMMQIAVVGLWYYEVVVESVSEEDTHLHDLRQELMDLLIHVTG